MRVFSRPSLFRTLVAYLTLLSFLPSATSFYLLPVAWANVPVPTIAPRRPLVDTLSQRVAYKPQFISNLRQYLKDPVGQFERIEPAQLQDPSSPSLAPQPPSGGPEAVATLDGATQDFAEGDATGSALASLAIMRTWPGTLESFAAESVLTDIGVAYAEGTVAESAIAAIETQMPAWEAMNTEERHALLSFYNSAVETAAGGAWGKAADVAGDQYATSVLARMGGAALDTAKGFALAEPASLYQISAMEYWLQTAHALSPETHAQAVAEVEALLDTSESPVQRLAGHVTLGNHYLVHFHNNTSTILHRASALEAASEINLASVYAAEAAAPWVKGLIGYFAAMTSVDLNRYEQALTLADDALQYVDPGRSRQRLEFVKVRALQGMNDYSIAGASEAYWDFIARNPDGAHTRKAFQDLAGIYLRAGDYDGAETILDELIERFPSSDEAVLAARTLNYLYYNFDAVQPVADRVPPGASMTVAKNALCGPEALHALLDLHRIGSTVEELAQLAGTDDTGTTVEALLEAARTKGLPLSAVQATALEAVPAPFIAFVDENHFLLLEAVAPDSLNVSDNGRARTLDIGAFQTRWSGLAFVTENPDGLELASVELVAPLKGATSGGSPRVEECEAETRYDDCCGGEDGKKKKKKDRCIGHACKIHGGGGAGFAALSLPSPALPGMMTSSLATVGVSSPGVSPKMSTFDTSMRFLETDLRLEVLGEVDLRFSRTYRNTMGFHRGEFTGSDKVWKTAGEGWTHNYNMFLQTSAGSPPSTVVLVDGHGSARTYYREGATDEYYKSGESSSTLPADVLTLNGDDTYTLTRYDGLVYEFSEPTNDSDRYARLESIIDVDGNEITLTYSGAVGTGKLTKVSSPIGDDQHLAFTYTGNLITKVELKEDTTVLQEVSFSYTSNELTTITDNDSNTVGYAYASDGGVAGSRYISAITDKRDVTTTFAWVYDENPESTDEAYKVEVTNADGLTTVYERNLTSDVCTITNWDDTTLLSKFVHTPVSAGALQTRYNDYYIDTTNYERWEFDYDGSGRETAFIAPGQVTVATYEYDANGRLITDTVGTSGPEVSYTYTGNSLVPDTVTGPDGLDADYTYNVADLPTQVTHPSWGVDGYQYEYDAYGNQTLVTNPLGEETEFAYDALGRLESVTVDPDGLALETSFVYDDFGNAVEQTDPRGKTTYYTYSGGGCGGCGGGIGLLLMVEDPLGNETEFEYDENGNRTLVIDALDRETAYEYDDMNRLITIISPAGTANEMTFAYNKLGQLVSQTSFEGIATTYAYDHVGRRTEVSDPEVTISTTYTAAGQLATVTDGNGNTTTYAYNSLFQLVEVADELGKETHYTYDSAGRKTEVGADTDGSFDPTAYFYSSTTGLLEKVRYYRTGGYDEAEYTYDSAARLVQLDDWLGGNGLRYAYDAAGRMTVHTDYDDSELEYVYDANGNVTQMTDYHGNVTSYVYNDGNQLTSMTAPGSKTWGFYYNALGQPIIETLPNGMATTYAYDSRNRLETIQHKTSFLFGTTVESFDYTLDDDGSITRIDEHSGAYWTYDYDGRNRLTDATYTTDWGHEAIYDYTYDDGDNMTAKSVPFKEDFNDGNRTGWNVAGGGTFDISGYDAVNEVYTTGYSSLYRNRTEQDGEIRFSYSSEDTSNNNYYLRAILRNHSSKRIDVRFYPNKAQLWEWDGTQWNTLDLDNTATTSEDTWYDVVCKLDGTDVSISRGLKGGELTEILSTSSAQSTTNQQLWFLVPPNAQFRIDDIKIIDGVTFSTYAMTYNDGNELTQMANSAQGTTYTFDYDDWGRTVEKTLGANSAEYAWRYDSKLYSLESTFPDEGDFIYGYGGDGKRRSRTADSETTGYNWDMSWTVIQEEDDQDQLVRSYLHNPQQFGRATRAHVDGMSPGSGAYIYYLHDDLGSTRQLHDESKALAANYAYSPFGRLDVSRNAAVTAHRFTGHESNMKGDLYFAPQRYYSSSISRWVARDPLGLSDGINLYRYAKNNPVMLTDMHGMKCDWRDAAFTAWSCGKCAYQLGTSVATCGACVACLTAPNPVCLIPCTKCVSRFVTVPLSCVMCAVRSLWMAQGCCGSMPSIVPGRIGGWFGDLIDLLVS